MGWKHKKLCPFLLSLWLSGISTKKRQKKIHRMHLRYTVDLHFVIPSIGIFLLIYLISIWNYYLK